MAIEVPGEGPISNTAGVQTAAIVGTVHADTGPIRSKTAGTYQVLATVGAEESARWDIQHRNASNTANVAVYSIYEAQSQSAQKFWRRNIGPGERIRIVNGTAITTGDSAAIIEIMRLK
jgi:hypothetical protein